MKESQLRSKLIKKLNASSCAAWPVENAVAVGMPDIYGVYNGHSFWIELKISRLSKKRWRNSTLEEIFEHAKKQNPSSWKRQSIWRSEYILNHGVNLFYIVYNSKNEFVACDATDRQVTCRKTGFMEGLLESVMKDI